MKITKKLLRERMACEKGLGLFIELYPNGFDEEWTLEKQIEIIKSPLRKYLGWAVDKEIIPLFSMAQANFSGADLRGADFSWANLSRANFKGTNLIEADFTWANLSYADLREVNLIEACLTRSDFTWAKLNRAVIGREWKKLIKKFDVEGFDTICWV